MSEFRGTPGPWVVDESRYEGSINRLEPFRHIGMVSQFQHDAGSREQNAANAKLIAAAPELLDALSGLLLAYEDPGNTGSTHDDKVLAARAAILKATA